MDLILIRHPAVDVAPTICYGCSDVPLAGAPQAEARALAARLARLPGVSAQAIHTSPLARCALLAAELGAALGCMPQADARLQEISFGAWEMQSWDTLARAELDAWTLDLEHSRPHGGESVAMVGARVRAWLGECEAAAEQAGGHTALVVSHAGVIRVLTALALHLPVTACLSWPLALGALCRLQRRASGAPWVLAGWNG
jgi:alpha-ribazole phosphatase